MKRTILAAVSAIVLVSGVAWAANIIQQSPATFSDLFFSRAAGVISLALPGALVNIGGVAHVATQTQLTLATKELYPQGLWRDRWAAGHTMPPLWFNQQDGTCAAAGLVSNGCGCTDGPDGNSWRAVHPDTGIDPRQCGHPTDGTTASPEFIQAAIDYSKTFSTTPPPVVFGGGIKYVVNDEIRAWAGTNGVTLKWEGESELVCNMTGAEKRCLTSVDPIDPATRVPGKLVLENARMNCRMVGEAINARVGPILLEARNQGDLKLNGYSEFIGGCNNTVISLSSCWNCDLGPASIWQGGFNWRYKDASALTFTIAQDSTSLVASGNHFSASDVGHGFVLWGPSNTRQQFIITAVVDPTHATVNYPAQWDTFTDVTGYWDGVRGTMTATSPVLTLDADVAVSTDVGRVVYVDAAGDPFAGPTRRALRGTIVSVDAANQVTLDVNADASVTLETVIPSPAVDLWSYDGNGNSTNDFRWDGLRIPPFYGTGLVLYGGADNRITNGKIHGANTPGLLNGTKPETSTYLIAAFFTNDWTVSDMVITGQSSTRQAPILVSGSVSDFVLGGNTMLSGLIRQPLVHMVGGGPESGLVVGNVGYMYPRIGAETLQNIVVHADTAGTVNVNGTVRSRIYTLPFSETVVITSDQTYTLPTWATRFVLNLVGQGGGAGSGMSGDAAVTRHGGMGGNSGSWATAEFRVQDLANRNLTIDIGDSAGTGGASATGAVGNSGVAGSTTTVVNTGPVILQATGGTQGSGGGSTAPTAGPAPNQSMWPPNIGAFSSAVATPSVGGQVNTGAPGGGGAGGGKDTGPVARNGSNGGAGYQTAPGVRGAPGTGGVVGGAACTDGGNSQVSLSMGGGGGGGAANTAGIGGAGCNGGVPGGGGGGGGASDAASASGAGGAGGRGEARITLYR